MFIGYVKSSNNDNQDLKAQIALLKDFGAERIYTEIVALISRQRPELKAALDSLAEGDILIVSDLNRAAETLQQLIKIIDSIRQKKAGFISINEKIDTTSTHGLKIMEMFAQFSEFDRQTKSQNVLKSLERAKDRGIKLGRKSKLTDVQWQELQAKLKAGTHSQGDLAIEYGVNRSTISRYLSNHKLAGKTP